MQNVTNPVNLVRNEEDEELYNSQMQQTPKPSAHSPSLVPLEKRQSGNAKQRPVLFRLLTQRSTENPKDGKGIQLCANRSGLTVGHEKIRRKKRGNVTRDIETDVAFFSSFAIP